MQILHVTTGANYNVTINYIRFINDNFEQTEHEFIVVDEISNIPSELLNYKNVLIIDKADKKYMIQLYKHMLVAEKIVFHSLWLGPFYLLFLMFKPSLMNKIFWVSWGMDSYQWKSKKKGFHYRIRNFIAYKFRQKIKFFVGIFPPDIYYFKKEFKSNAMTFHASYVDSINSPLYQDKINYKSLREKVSDNECINVQVGHSSSQVLNHLEVLNSLEKFKNENIKIFIPLSYGDKLYGDLVENEANKIFGDKAICLREMVDKESYYMFLSSIDIAIFNSKRQIGLGNINPLLYMEKKIFIPEGSVMYDFYNSKNIDIWNYNNVVDMDYNEFVKPLNRNNGRNFIIENEFDLGKKIDMWNKVFEAPMK
ncbi:MAG: hypothetical protein PWQ06_313 [Anaerophaga sp.]|nr:hypothetical protein [Anaerophaga sp.]